MDGLHDLGGTQGFGPVVKDSEPYHSDWEMRLGGIYGALVRRGHYNMDEYRHAIERMEPRHYVGASYFERTFTAVATLAVEKGLITQGELGEAAGGPVRLSRPSAPGRLSEGSLPDLKIGDRVVVRPEFVAGHIRVPAYVRGKIGVIVGESPDYPFPDAAGHGLSAPKQRTYDVCFKSSDLWPDGSEDADVHVGLFHGYLEKAAA